MSNPDVHALARKLDRYFVKTPTYIAFYDALRDAISQRRSDIAAGFVAEHDGFVLIGASGSGKTTLINRAITELAAPQNDAHLEIADHRAIPCDAKRTGAHDLQNTGLSTDRRINRACHLGFGTFPCQGTRNDHDPSG